MSAARGEDVEKACGQAMSGTVRAEGEYTHARGRAKGRASGECEHGWGGVEGVKGEDAVRRGEGQRTG